MRSDMKNYQELTKELRDKLILTQEDWSSKNDIKASLQSDVIRLLNRNGYPPMTFDDVYAKVLAQVENFKRYER